MPAPGGGTRLPKIGDPPQSTPLAWLNIALQPLLGNTWATGWMLLGVPSGLLDERQPLEAAAGGTTA